MGVLSFKIGKKYWGQAYQSDNLKTKAYYPVVSINDKGDSVEFVSFKPWKP